jgi:uncharacterized protein YprB with RNaseH-like and TPR domain
MSISLDKLKALRRQAGSALPSPPVAEAEASPVNLPPAPVISTAIAVDADSSAALRATLQRRLGGSRVNGKASRFVEDPSAPLPPKPASLPATANRQDAELSVLDWVAREVHHKPIAAPATPPAPAAVAPPQAAARTVQPRDVSALQRLLGTRQRAQRVTPPPAISTSLDRELPGEEMAPGLRLIEAFLPQDIPASPLSLAFAKRPDEAVAARDLLFFDTETTGLAGGTGTRAFMIGAADWHRDPQRGNGLRVRQLLMSTMAAESAMLDVFTSWLAPHTVLSSYNGRSYDAPLLKTRYRLARRREPLSALEHIDLLYPARRHWRGRWENCRLGTIERQVLGIVRHDDLPGAEAPAAWLSYLRGGNATNLRRVGEHNHQDVVTLAQLFLRLVEQQRNEELLLKIAGQT